MKPVNEKSAARFTVKFYNTSGQPFTPTTAEWRLRDVANDEVLQDWTTISSLNTSVTIDVSAELNTINNNRLQYQEQALGVRADSGLSTEFNDEIRYKVKNLKAFK